MKLPAVYIMANKRNGTLYVGVTSNLIQRIFLHKQGKIPGFTQKYGCKILVFFERHPTMTSAIIRESRLKNSPRKRKLKLIEDMNQEWKDLYEDILSLK